VSIHTEQYPSAGQQVTLADGVHLITPDGVIDAGGRTMLLQDWWDRLAGGSWSRTAGNIACLNYASRTATAGLPLDDKIVYVKDLEWPTYGHLVHQSEVST
jgi:hypothetical protein